MSGTGLMYRTPADVREIPNGQWDSWLRDGTVPWAAFAASAEVQMVLKWCIKAARGRA